MKKWTLAGAVLGLDLERGWLVPPFRTLDAVLHPPVFGTSYNPA